MAANEVTLPAIVTYQKDVEFETPAVVIPYDSLDRILTCTFTVTSILKCEFSII